MLTFVSRAFRTLTVVALVLGGIRLVSQTPSPFMPTRFTVIDAGTAGKPDMLLIPGLGSGRGVWNAEAAKLAPNFRLHLVQLNGFDGQPAGMNAAGNILPGVVDELHSYITATGMHPVVIGHSMGGLLTLMLVDKYPADAQKIVIVDSLPFLTALYNPAATAETAKPIADGIKTQMAGATDAQFKAMTQQSIANMVKNPEMQQVATASSLASDRGVFAESMAEDMTTDLRGDVATIKVPTLLLYPYDASLQGPDPAKVDAVYQGQYKPMPNVKLVRVDDSRHFIMYDQPAKFDAAVEAFVR